MKTNNPRCQTCDLRENSLFSVLKGDQIAKMDREKTVREFQRGEVIFYESTPAFAIYCVCTGWVKMFKVGSRAERQVVRLLGPGDVMGHSALLANETYSATAEMIETGKVCMIPKEPFIKMLEQSPQLALRLMSKLAKELRTSEDQMLVLSYKSVRQRVAYLLLQLMNRSFSDAEDAVDLKIPIQRNEMAQMIGTTPESLSRALRNFSQRGIIRTTRTKLHVINPSALRAVAGIESGIELT